MDKTYKRVLAKYTKKLLPLDHVVGVGYGRKFRNRRKTNEDSIIIFVDKKIPLQELSERDIIPQSLDHLKTDVHEIGQIKLLKVPRNERFRPAPAGVSIGHYKITAGTLGAIVKDNKTGEAMILSNNHVLANITNGHDGRSKIGDLILQPGSYDKGNQQKDVIGNLYRFIPINDSNGIFTANSNIVDCALAKPVKRDMIEDDILGIGKVKGIKEAEVDMQIMKSGRTTGLTEGTIRAVDSTVRVNIDDNRQAIFTEQIITTPISQGGDSGSLVLDRNRNAVGLLFAGSDKATICNKISNVLNKLDIDFFIDHDHDNKNDNNKDNGKSKDNGKDKSKKENSNESTGNSSIIFSIFLILILLILASPPD